MKRAGKVTLLVVLLVMLTCNLQGNNVEGRDIARERGFQDRANFENNDLLSGFIGESSEAIRLEREMAKMAIYKAADPEIKRVAAAIEAGHARLLRELDSMIKAGMHTITDIKYRDEGLRELGFAQDFDRQWCSQMIARHKKLIYSFQNFMYMTDDIRFRSWLSQVIPQLKLHLKAMKVCSNRLEELPS